MNEERGATAGGVAERLVQEYREYIQEATVYDETFDLDGNTGCSVERILEDFGCWLSNKYQGD